MTTSATVARRKLSLLDRVIAKVERLARGLNTRFVAPAPQPCRDRPAESIQIFSGEAGFSAFASKDVSLADLVSACYGHLKSLARFAGAVDV